MEDEEVKREYVKKINRMAKNGFEYKYEKYAHGRPDVFANSWAWYWMTMKNPLFMGDSPLDIIERGEGEQFLEFLENTIEDMGGTTFSPPALEFEGWKEMERKYRSARALDN